MKLITLTQGKVTKIDDTDFEIVNQHKWHVTKFGYAIRHIHVPNGKQKTVWLHRFLMSCPLGLKVDHIDGDKLNNRRSNLRFATKQENGWNRGKTKLNKSGYKGVCFWKNGWMAQIGKVYLGRYKTKEEAALVFNEASTEIYGEFGTINKI